MAELSGTLVAVLDHDRLLAGLVDELRPFSLIVEHGAGIKLNLS